MQVSGCHMQQVTFPEVAPLRQASRQVVRELGFLRGRLEALGLPYSQGHTLIELGAAGELAAAELAVRLNLDKSTTSRALAPLLRARLLVSRGDGDDGRRRLLSLSAAG